MSNSFAIALLALTSLGHFQSQPESTRNRTVSSRATGTFDVQIAPLEPYNKDDKSLGRFSIDKQFHGALEASSKGEMLTAGNAASSGGYVAIEKVGGQLDGRKGTFVLQHSAFMDRGKPQMSVSVVPDSGTGALIGISGKMDIVIEGGKHSYLFEFTVPENR